MRREKWCWSSRVCVWAYLHLDLSVYQWPHSRANMHPRLPFPPCSCNTLSSHRSPIAPHPHSPHVAPSFAHGPHFSSHPSLITQIRSSSNHHAEPLNTPHSHAALLIPLSSCPRFSSQFRTSAMNIAEVVWCLSALWFYSITTCEWGRVR